LDTSSWWLLYSYQFKNISLAYDSLNLNYTIVTNVTTLIKSDLGMSSNANKYEYIIFANGTGHIYIYDNMSGDLIWRSPYFPEGIGGVTTADWHDGDAGVHEIFVSAGGRIYVYDGHTRELEWISKKLGYSSYDVSVVDIDKDGNIEIITSTTTGIHYITVEFVEPTWISLPCISALILGILLTTLLHKYPEWYVIDVVGMIVAIGVTALIGISLAILPILLLLIILAGYDAISVYKTKHMVRLADNVMALRLPVLLVIPRSLRYSFLRQRRLRDELQKPRRDRGAMFIGLGDIIIPSTLAVSAYTFLSPVPYIFSIASNTIVAIGTLIGILGGFSTLMCFVLRGRPQAGLPLLNSGAITGYMISYYLVYRDLMFGIIPHL
jgi:presenilin-like A22 family membrane protease